MTEQEAGAGGGGSSRRRVWEPAHRGGLGFPRLCPAAAAAGSAPLVLPAPFPVDPPLCARNQTPRRCPWACHPLTPPSFSEPVRASRACLSPPAFPPSVSPVRPGRPCLFRHHRQPLLADPGVEVAACVRACLSRGIDPTRTDARRGTGGGPMPGPFAGGSRLNVRPTTTPTARGPSRIG